MFFNPFFLQLCIRSEPSLMPPRTPLRLWIRECERVVLKEITDGEWRKNFWMSFESLEKTGEPSVPKTGQHRPMCCKTTVKPNFSCYMTKERSKNRVISAHHPTRLDWKMINLENGLIQKKTQPEYAVLHVLYQIRNPVRFIITVEYTHVH